MSNVEIYLPAVDGGAYYLHEKGESCVDAIHTLFTDDYAAPPRQMLINIQTESGKMVKISIPYDHEGKASVQIDGVIV